MWKSLMVLFSCCVVWGYGYAALSCGKNKETRCIQDCPPQKTCRNREIQFNCLQIATPCGNKCVCKKGYITRSENGECIPMNECPRSIRSIPKFCNQNEEIQCVRKSCYAELSCNDSGSLNCPDVLESCEDRCVCKRGFFRSSVGNCITREQCDKCTGAHEYFDCGSACDNECETIHKQNKTNCPIVNIVCNPKCYCEDGFARDKHNNCIPFHKCFV